MTDIVKNAIEQLERVSNNLASIGETEDYTDIAIQTLEQTSWIPVSERLPKEDGMYLISTCMNCIDTCLFYKDDDEYLWVDYEDSVIAWMPLPEPYNEVK